MILKFDEFSKNEAFGDSYNEQTFDEKVKGSPYMKDIFDTFISGISDKITFKDVDSFIEDVESLSLDETDILGLSTDEMIDVSDLMAENYGEITCTFENIRDVIAGHALTACDMIVHEMLNESGIFENLRKFVADNKLEEADASFSDSLSMISPEHETEIAGGRKVLYKNVDNSVDIEQFIFNFSKNLKIYFEIKTELE